MRNITHFLAFVTLIFVSFQNICFSEEKLLTGTTLGGGIIGGIDIHALGGGDVIGNGGGLAEQNLLFSWNVLGINLKRCLLLPVCSENETQKQLLVHALDQFEKSSVKFNFGAYGDLPAVIVFNQGEFKVDSHRLYPDKKPWSFQQAFSALLEVWLVRSSEEVKNKVLTLATLSKGEEWGLSQYNYPEIRMLRYGDSNDVEGILYFQDFEKTYELSSRATQWVKAEWVKQKLCPGSFGELKIKDLEMTDVYGQDSSVMFAVYFDSKIETQCNDGPVISRGLKWKLPIEIKKGTFFDLKSMKTSDLELKLKEQDIRFLLY